MYYLVLIKLNKTRERAEDLLNGKLYCNRIKVLANRFDKYEGVSRIFNDDLVFEIDGFTFKKEDLAGPLEYKSYRVQNCHAYCMYSISNRTLGPITSENIEEARTLFTVPSHCAEEFGKQAVVVVDFEEFGERIRKAAVRENFGLKSNWITYYDPENPPENMHECMLPDNVLKQAFYKDRKFENENEFRFLIETGTEGIDPVELAIGDIRDIAFQVPYAKLHECFRVSLKES